MVIVNDGPAQVASTSSSVGASPTGSGVPETPLSVKSAGASPPQSSGKHLHINLGNQFRAGGSLPNVNNNVSCGNDAKEHSSSNTGAIHSIDLKVCTALFGTKLPLLFIVVAVRPVASRIHLKHPVPVSRRKILLDRYGNLSRTVLDIRKKLRIIKQQHLPRINSPFF
ncbi:hypothetical protein X777_12400 [Ooceraea biroi]|uniref:Uncharacterized protein n=1 Tax=Ooceraea biroi TaxID=2015173 RepID=A0A026W1M0_OOCBI|nr:hypothetical protein X777_12400 [Ooceraea biroi]